MSGRGHKPIQEENNGHDNIGQPVKIFLDPVKLGVRVVSKPQPEEIDSQVGHNKPLLLKQGIHAKISQHGEPAHEMGLLRVKQHHGHKDQKDRLLVHLKREGKEGQSNVHQRI